MVKKGTAALKINEVDNVATVFSDVHLNDVIEVIDNKGEKQSIKARGEIPFGHKIALAEIKKGQQITKYGEEIGLATENIQIGDYVHVHNLESNRARGDFKGEVS